MGKHFENAEGVHFRLFDKEAKIVTNKLPLITRAANLTGLTISEFCRMAAVQEARYVLLQYRKDKLAIAKKIIHEEELENQRKKFEEEMANGN
jgi:DNA polymerase elongation subunit (family B)